MIRFCEAFISVGHITVEEFNPYKYRAALQKLILETSNPGMTDTCLACGRNESQSDIGSDWIQCCMCERWLHSSSLCANVNIQKYSNEDQLYRCKLCELHFGEELR